MRIFLTGATGFIGSRIVPELLKAGHQVLGMTRSETGAQALRAAPLPPGLTKDEEKQYREGVEKQFVAPNLEKAREF